MDWRSDSDMAQHGITQSRVAGGIRYAMPATRDCMPILATLYWN
ncbi:hypothetical protein BIFGAL_03947 [Bifidobacterium gallicum DSM 20093 = LMG 11596]|uniref:Uncharacterized protein n=1 Tax=Bifidobacterium gallicum DSM 20093 = LMG 11596 TaxID=561180 RepID=D1NVQ5_9BIFI|nr:hypothetical protein BIFGAL_03947 [Bifidobacterium gallicum DSM 20093 = LMG 11596]